MADTIKPSDPDNEDAPFGYNDDGVTPLAPYGHKTNGKPRITNRGRRPGSGAGVSRGASTKPTAKKAQADLNAERKSALLQLSDIFIVTPLAALSTSKMLEKRIGEAQTDALAGDAVIWSYYAPSLADGLIAYSAQKPGVLAWLDGVEEKAPLLMLGQVVVQMGRTFVGNHMEPNADVAKAGRRLTRLNVAKMAQAIDEEAAAMGIPSDDDIAAAAANAERQANNAAA